MIIFNLVYAKHTRKELCAIYTHKCKSLWQTILITAAQWMKLHEKHTLVIMEIAHLIGKLSAARFYIQMLSPKLASMISTAGSEIHRKIRVAV